MLKRLYQQLFARSSIGIDILLTGGSNLIIVLLTFLSYGLVARIYDTADLGEYMMNRRLAAQILPFLVLCMPMALCRFLPLAQDNQLKKINYTVITTGFVLIISITFSVGILIFRSYFSDLFFDKQIGLFDMLGLVMLAMGAVLIEHLSAYFRGMLWIKLSNLIVLICTGLLPLLVISLSNQAPVYNLIFYTGLSWILVGAVFTYVVIRNIFTYRISRQTYLNSNPTFKHDLREITFYSLSRIPGILSMSLIWIVSPILLVHMDKMDKSAIILAGLQFLSVAVIPLRPISYVFFPLFSEYKAQNKQREISVLSSIVSSMAAILGLYFTLHFIVLAPVILEFWLNIKGTEAIIAVSILLLSMAPYMCFEINRNIIDTYFNQPYITAVTLASLVLMVGVPLALVQIRVAPIYAISIGSVAAFAILGIATDFIIKRNIIQRDFVVGVTQNIAQNLVFILVSSIIVYLVYWVLKALSSTITISILVTLELLLFYMFIWLNVKLNTTWVTQIVDKLRMKKLFTGSD